MAVSVKLLFVMLVGASVVSPALAWEASGSDSASVGALLCLDGMETDPFDDDQQATPISAAIDSGCLVPDHTVST